MHPFLHFEHFDLVTPDGYLQKIDLVDSSKAIGEVLIEKIGSHFVGYTVPEDLLFFNIKSTLAQLGLNASLKDHEIEIKDGSIRAIVEFQARGPLAREMLSVLDKGDYVGKLFVRDDRRRVRNPYYLERMFGRKDQEGRPLLSFGGAEKGQSLVLKNVDGYMVAHLPLRPGRIEYENTVFGFLPTLSRALIKNISMRELLKLHQVWKSKAPRLVSKDRILLVATEPLHIRTAFARVVDELLPDGFHHTSANLLQPDTYASGDIYELYGESEKEIESIPLEFYTLEPYREHVFFSDRDQLKSLLEKQEVIFDIFENSPEPKSMPAAIFIVKGSQLERLKKEDWIKSDPAFFPFPKDADPDKQAELVERYIKSQPCFPYLKEIENGNITSQGVLFSRFLPSPQLKRMLVSYRVQSLLHGIYFQTPSRHGGDYFSQDDRSLLIDLANFGIPAFWADQVSKEVLKFVLRPGKSSGLFVPLRFIETFRKATFFGIYGSNLLAGNFEAELKKLLSGILDLRNEVNHPMLHKDTPLALVTGGGPGAMEVGNRIAKELHYLSCAHVVDFRGTPGTFNREQLQNPYIEAKMTYRLSQLIERQAEFYLDFPIFVMGGIGTDFEYSLEELRHKVAYSNYKPIILYGEPDYWRSKITSRFQCNVDSGTIKGSEWVSNCFFCIRNAEQGIKIYRSFFEGTLPLGRDHPPELKNGFVIVE